MNEFLRKSLCHIFIKSSKTGEDIFVHNSGLIDEIREDDKVQFNTEEGRKGLNAVNVEVIA